ncbi:UDP-2,4-diacetamido-2,4,6-trideoxy-beta-L-altropyranose hydrolase [Solibacillus ferritrahens]|uniref:UDP-2,4-diacetamido-2,4, 6-trideoxy-beta-L-altropyranose hydrolase n=1 Tax=Solibacillus ferritrahens TaxID=3098620 RepID=UPI00300BAE88
MMNIIIRTDASIEIGSGHVMRCLTIAKKLREKGCCVKFWMKPLVGNLIDYVMQEGFENLEEAMFADMYIIDHYELGIEWEQNIRPFTKKLIVIDDLARTHECDLLLDQNIVPNYETRYDGKVPSHCVKLLGPKYLIMRDEFIEARAKLRTRLSDVRRLLIFMGGSDPTNETSKVLEALRTIQFECIDVVVGNSNPMKDTIREICWERGYSYHCQIDYMAKLMQLADFAVGAGGGTTWERCYVGLPSSATIVADNQRETTAYAASLGVVKNIGWHEQVTVDTYKQLLGNLLIDNMSEKGIELTATKRSNAWIYEILELKT